MRKWYDRFHGRQKKKNKKKFILTKDEKYTLQI